MHLHPPPFSGSLSLESLSLKPLLALIIMKCCSTGSVLKSPNHADEIRGCASIQWSCFDTPPVLTPLLLFPPAMPHTCFQVKASDTSPVSGEPRETAAARLDRWILGNIRDDGVRATRNCLLGEVCRPFSYPHAEVVAELGVDHLLMA